LKKNFKSQNKRKVITMKTMTREEFYKFPARDTEGWDKDLCKCTETPVDVVTCNDYAHNMTVTDRYSDSGMVITHTVTVRVSDDDGGKEIADACDTCHVPVKVQTYAHGKMCDYCHSFHPIERIDDCKCIFNRIDEDGGLSLRHGDAICVKHMKLHGIEPWEDEGVDPEYNDGVWDDDYDFIDGFSSKWIINNSSPDIEWTAADFRD
jgi:hypothetical protein